MPKSRHAEQEAEKKSRVGKKSFAEMTDYARVIENQSGLFTELVKEMKAHKVDEVEFDGINKMDRAKTLIDDFIDAADIAIRRAKRAKERAAQ